MIERWRVFYPSAKGVIKTIKTLGKEIKFGITTKSTIIGLGIEIGLGLEW